MAQKQKKDPLLKKIETLEAEIDTLEERREKAEDARKRALADLENFRRRETEGRKSWSSLAVAEFLQKLLPNFLELSLGAEHSADKDVKEVVEKFWGKLHTLGVEKIDPAPGTPLDPEKHEVLMTAEGEAGKVVQVLEPGWQFGGKPILPAKVSAAPES
ncbi:MAG: nucleotide exchange factor GrpE [Candidatus Gracilibacteria bacterium]|nr:nucleotide exchange factor GrpE [Candidatus Gracilibacteria bacterium]